MTYVQTVPLSNGSTMYVIRIENAETRYFNGRKYKVYTELAHYVHPSQRDHDFTQRTRMVYRTHPRYGYITSKPLTLAMTSHR